MDNWMVTILVVVLLLVVLDGVRRAIMRQHAAVKVSRDLSKAMQSGVDSNEDPLARARPKPQVEDTAKSTAKEQKQGPVNSELPGQVRVVQRRAMEDALLVNRQLQEGFISSCKPLAGSVPQRKVQEQEMLDLEEGVPTLMESVGEEQRFEPELNESESFDVFGAEPADTVSSREEESQQVAHHKRGAPIPSGAGYREEKASVREEVLVINVMAPEGDYFEGNDLLRVMVASGMRFGEMNIFHYHEGGGADGAVIFSLANLVVPGVFDLAQMEEFATPGISLFLALPIEGEAIKAFNQLLITAYNISKLLGGELKDENRSVFTAQTAEHYHQRVVEYQRRQALAMAQS